MSIKQAHKIQALEKRITELESKVSKLEQDIVVMALYIEEVEDEEPVTVKPKPRKGRNNHESVNV